MFFYFRKSITLIELLIAMILLVVIVLGVTSINVFSRYHVVSSDRRAKLQNDVARCLEHMTKYLSAAIGNETSVADTAVYIRSNPASTILSVLADTNGNGLSEDGGGDFWIRYEFDPSTHRLSYCNQCQNQVCSGASCSGTEDVLATNITAFSASKSGTPANNFSKGNYVNVSLTACWDPDGSCDTPDNPSVTMSSSIILPQVATN